MEESESISEFEESESESRICQYNQTFEPNPGVFNSGGDLYTYKASTFICAVMWRRWGWEINKSGDGKKSGDG